MNPAADMPNVRTLPDAMSAEHTATVAFRTGTDSLTILPLQRRMGSNPVAWYRARQRLGQIARLRPGWNGGRAAAPDGHTVHFAAIELAGLESAGVPAPTVNPSPDGAIYAEWHLNGVDLEVIFEAPYKIIALIEDARRVIAPFDGEDPDLRNTLEALKVLRVR
jgi:hypothetical protein